MYNWNVRPSLATNCGSLPCLTPYFSSAKCFFFESALLTEDASAHFTRKSNYIVRCGILRLEKHWLEWGRIRSSLFFASSRFFDRVDSEHNQIERDTNRVDFYHNRVHSQAEHNRVERSTNRVNPGDTHNTFFESTILKQMAYHTYNTQHVSVFQALSPPPLRAWEWG